MILGDLSDHLANRERFTVSAATVALLEPVKATNDIVSPELPRKQERYSVLVSKVGPP